jgi:serine/threonine protein kinase
MRIDPGHIQTGTILADSYLIVRKLAQGGMGVVYEARHLRLKQRRLAIKVLKTHISEDSELFKRFQREAEVCARLNHPHIVEVTDFNRLPDGVPYFVMDYLQGQDLDQRMSVGRVERPARNRILAQVVDALSYAHAQGVIHRDLKPSNIFLCEPALAGGEPLVKVLDFGISKLADQSTLTGIEPRVIGSPMYMSPEQARGRSDTVDARSDQFSLALIAYEMISGQTAFKCDTLESALYNIVHEDPPPLNTLTPLVQPYEVTAIARALSKKPEQRFPSVADFLDALLNKGASDKDHAISLAATRVQETAPARSRLARLWPLGLLLLFGVLAGLGWWWRSGTTIEPDKTGDSAVSVPSAKQETTVVQPPPGDALPGPQNANQLAATSPRGEKATRPPVRQSVSRPGNIRGEKGKVAPSVAHTDPGAAPKVQTASKPPSEEQAAEQLKPEVGRKLDEAERLCAAGRCQEAVHLVHQTFIVQDTVRARSLLVVLYCALSDLSNVRAALHKVPEAQKADVMQRCRKYGMEL